MHGERTLDALSEIDHVGIAVIDLDAAVREYGRAFGVEPAHRERVEDQGVEEVLFRVGTSYIQLLAPTGPETPVGRFLAKRGEGVHHVGYRVQDLRSVLARLRDAGAAVIDEVPRPGSRGTSVAFVHPRSFRGVLVELVQEGPGS
jgi:methylmalonyl-CoA/ethylmalonyl-CoA epimerase